MGDLTKDFFKSEFACKCGRQECPYYKDGSAISPRLVKLLQEVRNLYFAPMQITSGLRCEEHNRKVGGLPTSSHLTGLAADIKCDSSKQRAILLPVLWSRFARIGVARDFIHVDIDRDKPQDVMWVY